ncbi:hypothetical protein [Bdellovibrio sp. NC01]|uniref:hypothetical protein n=1 Tax=Bdellovibrio sp. NC01 TaxID=2220073 RepID=UPI001157E42E|nr:hypothetical protein [Bdellovibrio sp. NC01]QDK39382.1 hypothetical protein DOE51_18165 [Bdellovibrio sp. NC01]
MRILLVALLALSITACEVQDEQKQDDPNNSTLVNETNYDVCGISPAPHTIEGAWMMKQAQGAFKFTTTYVIANGSIQLINECNMNGSKLKATAMAPAAYDSTTVQPLRPAYDEQKIENPNFKMTCEASLTTQRLNYFFDGNCLVLMQPGTNNRITLVPQ